jgi:hypothetical protein
MYKFRGRQRLTIFTLTILTIGGIAGVRADTRRYKNLKVLPEDINDEKLDSIMRSYNKALGEKCSFCHSSFPNYPDSLDYASDKNEMKDNAREMMRMTISINKTYFYFDKKERPEYLKTVHCMTCHRGEAYFED